MIVMGENKLLLVAIMIMLGWKSIILETEIIGFNLIIKLKYKIRWG